MREATASLPDAPSVFTAALRAALTARGMQQQELAARIGRHKSLISRLVDGDCPVTREVAIDVASVLGNELLDAFNADLKAEAQRRAAVRA
jgi:plasmid maintenance system antidote protein VapI